MTGKDLIKLIKENGLEKHKVNIFTEENEQLEINSLKINPTKNKVAFGYEQTTIH